MFLKAVALCFVSFIAFPSSLPRKKFYAWAFSCHGSRMPFGNPLDKTGLEALTRVTFSKFLCYFIACQTREFRLATTNWARKKSMFLNFYHILNSMISPFTAN